MCEHISAMEEGKIEKEIFRQAKPEKDDLLRFGFKQEGPNLIYHALLLDGQFEANVSVSGTTVKGELIDLDTGDTYRLFRLEEGNMGYSHKVKEAYAELLSKIREACFKAASPHSIQAQRIIEQSEKKLGAKSDEPFADSHAVALRNKKGKWIGLIMKIKRSLLGEVGEDEVEVINVKSETVETLLCRKGYYPAYHMNKAKWITIALDGRVQDEEVLTRIKESLEAVGK